MRQFLLLVAASVIVSSAGGNAQAGLFLVGFELYSSDANGAALGTYRYSSNSNDNSLAQTVTLTSPVGTAQTKGLSFALATGANTFRFSPAASFNPGNFAGVEFFFNTTGASFNPTDSNHAGDLVVYASTAGGTFLKPNTGVFVEDYGPGGGFASYSGASSVTLGGQTVTTTAFNVNTDPSGTFTLNVTSLTAVPEPSSLMLTGTASLGLAIWARRRRKAIPA